MTVNFVAFPLILIGLISYYFKRSGVYPVLPPFPSTSETSSLPTVTMSLLPTVRDPLPDLFSGLVFAFRGLAPAEKRKWARFIIAYDGEVREEGDWSDVTHLVSEDSSSKDKASNKSKEVQVVSVRWLETCLQNRAISETTTI